MRDESCLFVFQNLSLRQWSLCPYLYISFLFKKSNLQIFSTFLFFFLFNLSFSSFFCHFLEERNYERKYLLYLLPPLVFISSFFAISRVIFSNECKITQRMSQNLARCNCPMKFKIWISSGNYKYFYTLYFVIFMMSSIVKWPEKIITVAVSSSSINMTTTDCCLPTQW